MFKREELYHGPYLEQAADLILAPYDGYDPKGPLYKETLTYKGDELVGMHTFDDAMLYVGGRTDPTDAILGAERDAHHPGSDGRAAAAGLGWRLTRVLGATRWS